MAKKKVKKQGPSKLFAEALKTIDLYLKGVTYGTFAQHRSNLRWAMPLSMIAPLIGVFTAWLWQHIFGAIAPLVVGLWFVIAIVPWLYLLWLALALYSPLIILTIPSEYSEKLKELNASPENAKKIVTKFSDIIAWILFAGLYCFFFKVWHNILAVIPLIVVVLYLIFGTAGKWIEPDPKFKQKLFKVVLLLIFIPLTLSFIQPTFYYHVFGRSPLELSNKFPESQVSLERLNKTIWKKKDNGLADSLVVIRRMVEKGKISPDSGRVLAEKLSKEIRQKSLLNQGKQGVDSLVQKAKKSWPFGKDTSAVEDIATTPPEPPIYQKILTLNGQWQKLETIPQYGFRYRFDLPDTQTEIQTMYERHPETKQIPNVLGRFCSVYVGAPNPGDIPWMVRTVSGEKKEILLTVTK